MNVRERWANYLPQVGIAFDQLVNALIPPLFTLSYADETLSARTWRAAKRGRVVGRIMLPLIDFMFRWQKPGPGEPVGHCERAFLKEQQRRNLPPEYREA